MKFCKQKGFNLLELMLGLVIVASVLLAAGQYYQIARENMKVAQAAYLINQLMDASFKYLELQPHLVKSDTLPALVEMDLLPQGFKDNKNLSPWSTSVAMSHQKSSSQGGSLEISIQNVPSKSCYNLVNLVNQSAKGSQTSQTDYSFVCLSPTHSHPSEKDFKAQIGLKGI